MKCTIAIDFDDTITLKSPYPIMGDMNPTAKQYIQKLYEDGYTLILWTCRNGRWLDEALELLKKHNLLECFTYINTDGSDASEHRKIVADFYIDDRAILGDVKWEYIYEYIKRHTYREEE